MTRWPAHHIEVMRRFYADLRTDDIAQLLGHSVSRTYAMAKRLGLRKSDAFLGSVESGRIQRGRQDPRLQSTQFQPGLTPWNKGRKGLNFEGSKHTQFKKGRPPQEARNYLPIGSYRVNADGHLEQKVNDDQTIAPALRWTPVYRLVWERDVGPIQTGFLVVFKRGLKTAVLEEITVDRLECIDRAENARRNHWSQHYPKEVAQLFQLKGAIKRQVNRIERESMEVSS